MPAEYPPSLDVLIAAFARLPGIGPKSPQRIAFHLLSSPEESSRELAGAIVEAKEKLRHCRICHNFSEEELCAFCRDARRDPSVICVVEEARDVIAMERTREFRGRYHVLGGSVSPMANIGPDDIRLPELVRRVESGEVREVIVATNPNMEGEATAMYIARALHPQGVRVTRIASGLPVGGDLEDADEGTLGKD